MPVFLGLGQEWEVVPVELGMGSVRVRVRGQGLALGLEVVLLLQQGQVPHLGLLGLLWGS